jgi:hypothetical protein
VSLRLRTAAIIGAVLVAFMVAIVIIQAPPAEAKSASADRSLSATGRVGFNCIVPRFGTTQCGPQFWVERGRTLSVYLSTSGGKEVCGLPPLARTR